MSKAALDQFLRICIGLLRKTWRWNFQSFPLGNAEVIKHTHDRRLIRGTQLFIGEHERLDVGFFEELRPAGILRGEYALQSLDHANIGVGRRKGGRIILTATGVESETLSTAKIGGANLLPC